MAFTSFTRLTAGITASLLALSGIVVATPSAAALDESPPAITATAPDFVENSAPESDRLIIPDDPNVSYFVNESPLHSGVYNLPSKELGLAYDASGTLRVSVTAIPTDESVDLVGDSSWSFIFYECNPINADDPDDEYACKVSGSRPTITGKTLVGQTLKVKPGTWPPDSVKLSYQWKRDGKSISGATKTSYKLAAADIGKKISVTVTGQYDEYVKAVETSPVTAKVRGVLTAATPKISGTAKVGKTLKASVGAWKPGSVKFSYQWKRDGKSISGATKTSYKVTSKDVGKKITVTVKGKKSGYTSASKTSSTTATVKQATKPKSKAKTQPNGWNCPSWAPIKGNASSMIYHVPGGAYYNSTKPEACFATSGAAEDNGYRASKR